MFIKEFENDVPYALIADGRNMKTSDNVKSVDESAYLNAGLVIELYNGYYSVVKNIYGIEDKNIPIILLDDYLSHYSNKFQHKSSILDNFESTSISDLVPSPLTNKYSKLSDIIEAPY